MWNLVDSLQPILENVTGVALASLVWVCLPLALFRRTRRVAGRWIQVVASIWGTVLWFTSALVLYGLWGWWGIGAGIVTGVVTVIPLAVVASLVRGGTNNVALLSMWAVAVFILLAFWRWVASKGGTRSAVSS
jgi:Kef-type K+ transport system membrane component KefB